MSTPQWEVIGVPKLWADMTDEEREDFVLLANGIAPVKWMSRDDIEAMYAP